MSQTLKLIYTDPRPHVLSPKTLTYYLFCHSAIFFFFKFDSKVVNSCFQTFSFHFDNCVLALFVVLLQIKMFLSIGSKLLDTTKSIPNYKTACPPPGKSFVSRCHMFTSMIAVQSFWSDLKCVCLNTPLGKFSDGL